MDSPKIGIIIPDRGDRPQFLLQCLRMLNGQTLQPFIVHIVNFPATDDSIDITKRYRMGYTELCRICPNLDVIALIENDDWYAPDYLETMWNQYVHYDKPEIFGTNHTIYYNLRLRKYFTFHHSERASAMNTLIKPGLDFAWCPDNYQYTDMHLWEILKGTTFQPDHTISLGIKHGIGKCGGVGHTDGFHRYQNDDDGFLQRIVDSVDPKSFRFYFELPLQ